MSAARLLETTSQYDEDFQAICQKNNLRKIAGEILLHEFLKPLDLSQNKLAQDIGVSPRRINEIVHGKRAVTADATLRLARYFQMSPQFWLGLQMDYELDLEKDRLAEILVKDVKVMPMKKCSENRFRAVKWPPFTVKELAAAKFL